MKNILWLALCLLLGCDELKKQKIANEPIACNMLSITPISDILIRGLQPNTFYQYWIDDKLLWDECARLSEMDIYKVTSYGSIINDKKFEGVFDDVLNCNKTRARVYKLDAQCNAIQPVLFDKVVEVKEYTINYGDPACGSSYVKKSVFFEF